MDIVCNPRYSTAMGLLLEANNQNEISKDSIGQSGTILDIFKKMKSWFVGNF
jgi:cell division protein FtsA